MNANEILKKHEDANEMHFHEVDRKWIIEAMEEYAALRQPPVISRRELLIAFHDSLIGDVMPINKFHSHRNVDSFLASNSL